MGLQLQSVTAFLTQMRPTTGPTRKDGVKQKHSVFRNSSQPPKVELFVGKLEAPIPSMNLFDLVIYINLFSGDVYKPRRPGDAGHRALGAGRGDTAGLGQVHHLHLFPGVSILRYINISILIKYSNFSIFYKKLGPFYKTSQVQVHLSCASVDLALTWGT